MNLPVQFLIAMLSIWLNRRQQLVVDYLREENRLLREQLGGRRIRWTDKQRRRLAEKGKALGRAALMELATIVTSDTILRWYRDLVAAKYDGIAKRGPGRPRVANEIPDLILKMARENPAGATREFEELYAILAAKSVGARSSEFLSSTDWIQRQSEASARLGIPS